MKVITAMTKCLLVSRSRTALPPHGNLFYEGSMLVKSDALTILGVLFDAKLTFASHIRSLVSSASQKLGILRKVYSFFRDAAISASCYRCFILPLLEYCAPVWRSAAACHLHLLDRIVHTAGFLCDQSILGDLSHRRDVSSVCMLFKIRSNPFHPLYDSLPELHVPARNTRLASSLHPLSLEPFRCRTSQYQRCFLPSVVHLWNSLNMETCMASDVHSFKCRANNILK